MKVEIVCYPKGKIACITCKSSQIKIVFTKTHKIAKVLKSIDNGTIQLLDDCSKSDVYWVCGACYDVGKIA